ncbi:MAG: hypothetical protein R3C11_28490 [Planctomycetaceae bacterium]
MKSSTQEAGSPPKYKGESIPTLVEVLETIPEGKRLFIEVKCGRKSSLT